MSFITKKGEYYEGDKRDSADIDVPCRPSQYHEWSGSEWVLNSTAWLDGEIRLKRDDLLDKVDLKCCNAEKWSGMTAAKKAEWKAYKQALKDLPETIDPNNPVWPVMPS